jgi:hypothetical protein
LAEPASRAHFDNHPLHRGDPNPRAALKLKQAGELGKQDAGADLAQFCGGILSNRVSIPAAKPTLFD